MRSILPYSRLSAVGHRSAVPVFPARPTSSAPRSLGKLFEHRLVRFLPAFPGQRWVGRTEDGETGPYLMRHGVHSLRSPLAAPLITDGLLPPLELRAQLLQRFAVRGSRVAVRVEDDHPTARQADKAVSASPDRTVSGE